MNGFASVWLPRPDIKKYSFDGVGDNLRFGGSSMKGWRKFMEDAHIVEPNFTHDSSLFAVFDGHGGAEVARFCGRYFGEILKSNKYFNKEVDIPRALEDSFFDMDDMLQDPIYNAELTQ